MFVKILVLLACLHSIVFASQNMQQSSAIVSVSWLQKHLDEPNLVIIDVRDQQAYKKGHIKGAVNMPIMKDFFTPKTLQLPKLSFLKKLFSDAGIDNNTKVVVYDNGQFCWAARAYWVLKVLGHKSVWLLEYGYGKYIQKHFPISTKTPIKKHKNFTLQVNNDMIQTKLGVLMSIGKKPILDGRTEDMYIGRTSAAKRYGHIPTAQLFSGSNNYKVTKNGNKIKSLPELKSLYVKLPKDKQIILYCQDGADAALDYIFMNELGYKVAVYEGSWLEWGNDAHTPIVNPSAKKK